MTCCVRLLALLAGAAGLAGSAAAQVAGLPVRNAGIGTGIGIAADVGFPNGAYGDGTAFGVTGAAGFGPLGVSATLARWSPEGGDGINSVGATVNLKIFGGPLVPIAVTLQGGAGYWSQTDIEGGKHQNLHLPVGVGVALTIPNPVMSIKPWVAPRLDLRVSRESGGILAEDHTGSVAHFGVSGGVDLGFLNGLSVRAMYDRVQWRSAGHPSVLSLGLGFRVGT